MACRTPACSYSLLFGSLQEHGDLLLDVGLPEDLFDVRPILWPFAQHPLDELSQLRVVLTGHLWKLGSQQRGE